MTRTMTFGPIEVLFDEGVLEPRPWTLAQSEWGAELAESLPSGPVLELCSGVGHIGLALARLTGRGLVLVDANRAACSLARRNADAAGLEGHVDVRFGSMTDVLAPAERFVIVTADPPYIPSVETGRFPEDPLSAIDGGADGLEVARMCLQIIGAHLAPDGEAVLQVLDGEQAERLGGYLASAPHLGLAVHEVRLLDLGALIRLVRTPAA